MKKENIHEELEQLSPLLYELKKQGEVMYTPPDYFEGLEEKVYDKLEAEGGRIAPPTSPWKVWLSPLRLSVAAALTAIMVSVWGFLQPTVAPQAPMAATTPFTLEEDAPVSLNSEVAASYIKDNILEFDEDALFAAYFEEDDDVENKPITTTKKNSKKITPSTEDLDEILDDLTDEELEDLL